ncbi:hypothetical protein PMIN05_012659 [Paraphaeosphaeria minitans]
MEVSSAPGTSSSGPWKSNSAPPTSSSGPWKSNSAPPTIPRWPWGSSSRLQQVQGGHGSQLRASKYKLAMEVNSAPSTSLNWLWKSTYGYGSQLHASNQSTLAMESTLRLQQVQGGLVTCSCSDSCSYSCSCSCSCVCSCACSMPGPAPPQPRVRLHARARPQATHSLVTAPAHSEPTCSPHASCQNADSHRGSLQPSTPITSCRLCGTALWK